jgi:hypothetical protein
MRSLIKNDPGVQYEDEGTNERMRRRRRAVRLFIALSSIGLAGFFVFQLARSAMIEPGSGPAVSWNDPKSFVTWARWSVSAVCVQIRGAVSGSFPSGNAPTILKMCLCFGLGALFLRTPQRY